MSTLKRDSKREDETQTVVNPVFAPRAALVDFILNPDFDVVSALCEVVLVHEEGRTLAEALIDFFEAHGKTEKLFEWAISKEISTTTTSSTLFRGSSEVTKLMPVLYSRLGKDYLKYIVGPLVKDITTSGSSFEIDPNRAEKGVNARDNLKKVLSITKEFLEHIVKSIDHCPNFLRRILEIAKKEVLKKFPDSGSIVVGVFFFSRYIIPAVISPAKYGLVNEPPMPKAQQGLVLISKILQNLANEIEFDETKEEHLSEVNKFMQDRVGMIRTFFDKLASSGESLKGTYGVTNESENNALTTINFYLKENSEKVFQLISKPENKQRFFRVVEGLPRTSSKEELMTPEEAYKSKWTPRKKKLEKMKAKYQELAKVERLETLLEEEIRARRGLEKQLTEFAAQLEEQRKVNEANKDKIASLEAAFRSLTHTGGEGNSGRRPSQAAPSH